MPPPTDGGRSMTGGGALDAPHRNNEIMVNRPLSAALLASAILHAELLAILSAPLAGRGEGLVRPVRPPPLEVRIVSARDETVPPVSRHDPASLADPILPLRNSTPFRPGDSRLSWDAYLPAARLDERPTVLVDIPIDPPELREHSQGGRLILTLWIGSDGAVENVTVDENSLPAVFAESAVRGFLSAKFSPGRKDGVAVKTRMQVAVSYLPLGPAAEPVPAGPVRAAEEK